MPLISRLSRTQTRVRVALAGIYLVLGLGAVTMAYPFLLMLAGSTKSGTDQTEQRLIPAFLTDDTALYRKHIEALFDENLPALQLAYDTDTPGFDRLSPPAAPDRRLAQAWEKFIREVELPAYSYAVGYMDAPVSRTVPSGLRAFQNHLCRQLGDDLDRINAALGTEFADWSSFQVLPEQYLLWRDVVPDNQLTRELWKFKANQPLALRRYFSVEGAYQHLFLKSRGATSGQTHLARRLPEGSPAERENWEEFVRTTVSPLWVRSPDGVIENTSIEGVDFQFHDYLKKTVGSVPAGWTLARAQRDFHYLAFLDMRRALRWEFLTRNYRTVIGHLVRHGRGVTNTLVYCALAVLAALIVNPAAAYALSRWKGPAAPKLVMLLIATMAFPPLLIQIPSFLLLRNLNLLNTFAALVLPGLANGFSIFLLKGFFDSQPRELYECASLDGAGEWRMFWHIGLSLSKPILAVTALGAFITAYTNFMFALLICQDQKMWTLMVWLYQLQQRSGPGVIYASLILAAIPTLVIFLAAQQVIIRGIVIPSES